ncbi:adhesion G protein-coupled receptor E3, partial [Biomphalaria glabrata]
LNGSLIDTIDGYSYQLGVVQEVHEFLSDRKAIALWADIYILASRLLTRDSFEDNALDIFFGSSNDQKESTFLYFNILTEDKFTEYTFTYNLSIVNQDIVANAKDYGYYLKFGMPKSIILSSTLTCSFLTFQETNFTIEMNIDNEVNITVTLDVGGTKLTISNMSDVNSMVVTGNNELNICIDILEKYVKKTRSRGTNRPIDGVLYVCANVLTYICLSASELCLFITLITYIVFAELRTVPGINNIFLTLSLFMAQLALIAASNFPTPSALCTYTGIVTHFLWLWHFTWSFLCSLHMFRVFTSKVSSLSLRSVNVSNHVIKVMTFSLSVSVSIVALVIISSHLTSKTIGYGKKSCYLDSAFLI